MALISRSMNAIAVSVFLIAGCAGYRGQEEVKYAINETYPAWEAAQVRLELSYLTTSFGVRFVEVPSEQAELKIESYEASDTNRHGYYTGGTDAIHVNFAVPGITAGQLRHNVGHEVGHWLGLQHNCSDCENLMSTHDYRYQTGTILSDDVRAFRTLWPSIPQTYKLKL